MFVVISSLYKDYPEPIQVEIYEDFEKALDRATSLCLEQGDDEEDEIREELKEDGFYIPFSRSEWSVFIIKQEGNQHDI